MTLEELLETLDACLESGDLDPGTPIRIISYSGLATAAEKVSINADCVYIEGELK